MSRRISKPARVRQETLMSYLRSAIVAGRYRPGDRLPPQAKLMAQMGGSPVTVDRAFRQLVVQGFARAEPGVGTFVADLPPHLTRYALAFPGAPDSETPWLWSRFYDAIIQASHTLGAERRITFPHFYDVEGHPDSEGYQSLMREVEAQRLAGIIFALAPPALRATPLMERADPPRAGACEGVLPGALLDVRQFIYRARDFLLADGRRRFAAIALPKNSRLVLDEYQAAIESLGGITQRFWMQGIEPHHVEWFPHAVRAILQEDPDNRPDALMITDDHLVEPVAAALEAFGVRVPEQMRVVGHWNFPLPYRGRLPIDLLGFDARELLRHWVEAIDAQRRGQTPAMVTVPARFAWEVPKEAHEAIQPEDAETLNHRTRARGRAASRVAM